MNFNRIKKIGLGVLASLGILGVYFWNYEPKINLVSPKNMEVVKSIGNKSNLEKTIDEFFVSGSKLTNIVNDKDGIDRNNNIQNNKGNNLNNNLDNYNSSGNSHQSDNSIRSMADPVKNSERSKSSNIVYMDFKSEPFALVESNLVKLYLENNKESTNDYAENSRSKNTDGYESRIKKAILKDNSLFKVTQILFNRMKNRNMSYAIVPINLHDRYFNYDDIKDSVAYLKEKFAVKYVKGLIFVKDVNLSEEIVYMTNSMIITPPDPRSKEKNGKEMKDSKEKNTKNKGEFGSYFSDNSFSYFDLEVIGFSLSEHLRKLSELNDSKNSENSSKDRNIIDYMSKNKYHSLGELIHEIEEVNEIGGFVIVNYPGLDPTYSYRLISEKKRKDLDKLLVTMSRLYESNKLKQPPMIESFDAGMKLWITEANRIATDYAKKHKVVIGFAGSSGHEPYSCFYAGIAFKVSQLGTSLIDPSKEIEVDATKTYDIFMNDLRKIVINKEYVMYEEEMPTGIWVKDQFIPYVKSLLGF